MNENKTGLQGKQIINFHANIRKPFGYIVTMSSLIVILFMVVYKHIISDIDYHIASLVKKLQENNQLYMSPIFYFLNHYLGVLCLIPFILIAIIMFELKSDDERAHTYWIYAFYHFSCASAFILLNVFLNLVLKNLANRVRPY